jgi:hypothetical protein
MRTATLPPQFSHGSSWAAKLDSLIPLRFRGFEWWAGSESNTRHEDFQSSALPTELPAHRDC